jgi:hypothetical protein
MDLLASFIRNIVFKVLEEEFTKLAPEIKDVALRELKELGQNVIDWAEKKINIDIDGDGKIGG